MNEVELGAVLKRLIEELGFSEWQISRRANVKTSLVSAALRGSGRVPIAAWCRLARAVELEVELTPAPPYVRTIGPVESVVDLALRRIVNPFSVDAELLAAGGDGSGHVLFDELGGLATAAFASMEEADAWLRRPHPLLEGKSPLEFAKSGNDGVQRVRDMLVAIEHGGAV